MMAYDKSIINIDINFDNEPFMASQPSKPKFVKKIPKDRITVIQPSVESTKTESDIEKRVNEVQRFRRESQSALNAPLLVKALIKKTYCKLDTIAGRSSSVALEVS
ncbi:hypothetical protein AC249_AIPGENE1091 [Exaiptasia diaphana]|nr:hypothetical protein AC249_AIPGENE1091 [Exaiptasia diaphana]